MQEWSHSVMLDETEGLTDPHQSPWILERSFGDIIEKEGRKVGSRSFHSNFHSPLLRYLVLQMDEAYEPPTNETRTVYGLQLQVRFCKSSPILVTQLNYVGVVEKQVIAQCYY